MITREQVADLRPGDVVELRWTDGSLLCGPLRPVPEGPDGIALHVGPILLRHGSGSARLMDGADAELVVVSRVPRPLYINFARTHPVAGDVARVINGRNTAFYAWQGSGPYRWIRPNGDIAEFESEVLVLLVDGETGQVVL